MKYSAQLNFSSPQLYAASGKPEERTFYCNTVPPQNSSFPRVSRHLLHFVVTIGSEVLTYHMQDKKVKSLL